MSWRPDRLRGCTRPGVKPLHCFCQQHYDSLDEPERDALRLKQIAQRNKEKKEERNQQRERERKTAGKSAA